MCRCNKNHPPVLQWVYLSNNFLLDFFQCWCFDPEDNLAATPEFQLHKTALRVMKLQRSHDPWLYVSKWLTILGPSLSFARFSGQRSLLTTDTKLKPESDDTGNEWNNSLCSCLSWKIIKCLLSGTNVAAFLALLGKGHYLFHPVKSSLASLSLQTWSNS